MHVIDFCRAVIPFSLIYIFITVQLRETIAKLHSLHSRAETRVLAHICRKDHCCKNSSTDSDWDSPLPPIQEPLEETEHVMGPAVQPLISPAALFPPISAANLRNK